MSATPTLEPQGGARRAALLFIFVTVVLDMLAIGIIVPVLPKLVEAMAGGDTAHAARVYGVFGTAWALMQFLFSPVQGALSDRFGRRPVILLSNLGLGLDYVLMAVAQTLPLLFVGRVLSGITAASISTAGAYIADVTPPEKRAGAFGMLGAAFGLGFVLGPALGGYLGHFDPRLPFWAAAGLSFANLIYGWAVLPESLAIGDRSPFSWRRANPVGSLKLLRSHPQLTPLAVVHFLSRLSHDVLPSTSVLYAGYRYGWGAREIGLMLAGVGVCSTIVQAGLVGRIVGVLGERTALRAGLLFGAIGFLLHGLASNSMWFIAGVPFISLWGIAGPSLQGLMTRRLGAGEQGQLQGALASLMGIAGMIGPGLFTQTFAASIDPLASWSLPGAPFLLSTLLLLLALGVSLGVEETRVPNAA